MHYLGQEYKNEQDMLKLFLALNVSSLEAALDKSLNQLDKPNYEVAQFLLSFFPKVDYKESITIYAAKNPELADYIFNHSYKQSYIQLNIYELAGLLNARGSFFNDRSLKLNALSFHHDDFKKNLEEIGINLNTFVKHLDEEKLDLSAFMNILRESQQSFHINKTQNYQILLEYYKLHIEGQECHVSSHDKHNMLYTGMLSLDFFKVLMKTRVMMPSEYLPNYHSYTTCLETACSYSQLDIVKYLIEELNVNAKDIMVHNNKKEKDLIFKALLSIRDNTDKMLDFLFNHINYDFNRTYEVYIPENIKEYRNQKKQTTMGKSYYFLISQPNYAVDLIEYLDFRKDMDCPEEDKAQLDKFMLNYENSKRIIEKYKFQSQITAKENIKNKMKL